MTDSKYADLQSRLSVFFEFAKVIFFVYCFLVSIDMMGIGFKASKDTIKPLLDHATTNPFIGLVLGIVVTSIIQSSSSTTSIVVAMVGAGTLPLTNAIPVVMGANIGTTVTNTIVSFGYVGRKTEFQRSFGASIVHDMFNITATLVLFPLEMGFHFIERSAHQMERVFEGAGGFTFVSPLKVVVHPVADLFSRLLVNHYVLIVFSLVFLFFSMSQIIRSMKGIVLEKIERVLNNYLFKNALISIFFGMLFTAVVQSSSITTSIIIPLVGAGILTIEQIFPYTLGANIGTTITAILASLSLAVGAQAAMTVAFCHLLFNIFGIVTVYPIKFVPIGAAKAIAAFVATSKKHFIVFLVIYVLLHVVPIVFAVID